MTVRASILGLSISIEGRPQLSILVTNNECLRGSFARSSEQSKRPDPAQGFTDNEPPSCHTLLVTLIVHES